MDNQQLATVTRRTIEGAPIRQIAQEIGVSHTTVMRAQHKPEIRAKIEAAGEQIINRGLKPAVNTILRLSAMGNVKGQDKDMLKLALDASKHVTSMAGLSGTTPSTIINNLMLVNQAPEQAQELSGIQAFLSHSWQGGETIDAEIEGQDTGQTDGPTIGIATTHTPPTDIPAGSSSQAPDEEADETADRGTI